MPAGCHPTAIAFGDDASSIAVACDTLIGSSLYMYGEEKPKASDETKQQPKLPLPEIKWKHQKVHDKRAIITLVSTTATYGSADGSTIIASCSEGSYGFYYSILILINLCELIDAIFVDWLIKKLMEFGNLRQIVPLSTKMFSLFNRNG